MLINLFGGPGTGKSTMATRLFSEFKMMEGFPKTVEYIPEYVKALAWANIPPDQFSIAGRQWESVVKLYNHVDILITDSPIVLSAIYFRDDNSDFYKGIDKDIFDKLILGMHNNLDSVNYVITRTKTYKQDGRYQTAEQAIEKDSQIETFLNQHNISYKKIPYGDEGVRRIVYDIFFNILKLDNN